MPKTAAKLDDFEVLATIGTGSFGTCRKVRRKGDGKVPVEYSARGGGGVLNVNIDPKVPRSCA